MMLSWTSFSMCISSPSRAFSSWSSSWYRRDSSAICCFSASSRCLAAAFSAASWVCACWAWLNCSALVAASASSRSICRRSCERVSRCSLSVLSAWTSASRWASSYCLPSSAISCCSSASRLRQVSRSLLSASASSARAAFKRASSPRWTSASALHLCSSPSTVESFCHCCSLCCRRFLRSSSKLLRSRLSSSCLSWSIFARSSADARRTRRSPASSSADLCIWTASWTSACSLITRASCSSA
mmetsp:Transcript_19621/g.59138  ORF Transcript_19621/g.59138 Transcript_19621/m.59138 type:complete len:243 (-) Transcript_19621:1437-2165(-)